MTQPKFPWIQERLNKWTTEDPEFAFAVAAVRVLVEVLTRSSATTMMELKRELDDAKKEVKNWNPDIISLSSGCELFTRFVTRASLEIQDFETCKERLLQRAERFFQISSGSKKKISQLGQAFIRDGMVVLVHGFSRVVTAVLLHAASQNRRFSVIATETRPTLEHPPPGLGMASRLTSSGIPFTLIVDSAVAYVMPQVDFILCGAEAVVENGGIINKIGTYQVSIVAKEFNKPLYVCAESFKFARLYPLDQGDIPNAQAQFNPFPDITIPSNMNYNFPLRDYTPPSYISLLFTDLGILTPSAVSDELIKLYT